METTKLSSKGQIVLPSSVRAARRWKPGITLVVENRPEGVLLRAAKPFVETRFDDVMGMVCYKGPRRTLEEMENAVLREAGERK